MGDPGSSDGFIDKWRMRWPEWGIVSVFVPASQRAVAAAWLALLQELRDAAWAGDDPTPGLAKLAWWQEELRGWAMGARRHPLGETLQKHAAPWGEFGAALAVLPATRAPASIDDDDLALEAFATATLACETVLFDAPSVPGGVKATASCLRGERALVQGDREVAADIQRAVTGDAGVSRVRRLQQAIVRERLGALARGDRSPRIPAFRLLLASWRAARG